jgi:hypothetical protein
MNNCFWPWSHDWDKWEQYIQNFSVTYNWGNNAGRDFPYIEYWQKRKCKKCGKEEREEIKGS